MNGVKISDHQQSMAARPLRRAFLIPSALLVVADFAQYCNDGGRAQGSVRFCSATTRANARTEKLVNHEGSTQKTFGVKLSLASIK